MNCAGRDEKYLARVQRDGRAAVDLIHERSLDDINDLFAGMRVIPKRDAGCELDTRLNHLAAGNAQIMPLQIFALDAGLLRLDELKRERRRGDNTHHQKHNNHLHRSVLPRHRNDLNAARISEAKSSGYSHAAK